LTRIFLALPRPPSEGGGTPTPLGWVPAGPSLKKKPVWYAPMHRHPVYASAEGCLGLLLVTFRLFPPSIFQVAQIPMVVFSAVTCHKMVLAQRGGVPRTEYINPVPSSLPCAESFPLPPPIIAHRSEFKRLVSPSNPPTHPTAQSANIRIRPNLSLMVLPLADGSRDQAFAQKNRPGNKIRGGGQSSAFKIGLFRILNFTLTPAPNDPSTPLTIDAFIYPIPTVEHPDRWVASDAEDQLAAGVARVARELSEPPHSYAGISILHMPY